MSTSTNVKYIFLNLTSGRKANPTNAKIADGIAEYIRIQTGAQLWGPDFKGVIAPKKEMLPPINSITTAKIKNGKPIILDGFII